MRLRVSQRERAAPRAAKDLPALNPQMLAYPLYVRDQMPSRIVFQIRVRRALARAALVKEDYAIRLRVKEAALFWDDAAARPAVQKDHWLPVRVAALLVINRVHRRDLKHACIVWLNRWI